MMDLILPLYGKLKAKDKKWLSEKSYLEMFMQIICSMFKYTDEDPAVTTDLNFRLELYLRLYGKVGFTMDKGKLIFGKCHYTGKLDYLGRMDKVVITTDNGEVYERKIGKNAVVMFNNILGHSETSLGWLCKQLTENEVNEFDLLINARSHPIIIAPDDNTKTVIENVFKGSNDGLPRSIAYTDQLVNGMMGAPDPIKVLTVTDPQTAELFQYYSHYHLDLTERIFTMYGLSTFNTGKMAQTNNLEVSGSLASSMAIPFQNYKMRLDALEEIKRVFDIDISIEFTESWKNQVSLLSGIDKDMYDIEDNPEEPEEPDGINESEDNINVNSEDE